MTMIDKIVPRAKHRVIDLLSSLGIDVTPWSEGKGGVSRAANNPKYCFEWAYDDGEEIIVVNFWIHQLLEENGQILWRKDIKDFTQTGDSMQQARGRRLEAALQRAIDEGIAVRVIICCGERRRDGEKSVVAKRGLDEEAWAVTAFDRFTGVCEVSRGALIREASFEAYSQMDAKMSGFEGVKAIRWFLNHRRREWRLRKDKISSVLFTKGKLVCDVPKCGFDFNERYGLLGKDYAHVHHREALSSFPLTGKPVSLNDLAIVCANCHAMIHRGGACRKLEEIAIFSA